MAKKRRSPKIKKLALKQQRGPTKKVTDARPGKQPAKTVGAPREKVKVLKGQVSLKARATKFAQQQREQRTRSIVGRKTRGRIKIPGRLKQYRGVKAGTVIDSRPVNSSWVASIELVMLGDQPALGVTFLSGVSVVYTRTNLQDFELMAAAASKGKFIWRRLYHGIPGQGSPYKFR